MTLVLTLIQDNKAVTRIQVFLFRGLTILSRGWSDEKGPSGVNVMDTPKVPQDLRYFSSSCAYRAGVNY